MAHLVFSIYEFSTGLYITIIGIIVNLVIELELKLMDRAILLLSVLYSYNLLYYGYHSREFMKKKNEGERINAKDDTTGIDVAVALCSCLSVIILLLFFVFRGALSGVIGFIVISLPVILGKFNEAIVASKTVTPFVLGNKSGNANAKVKYNFDVLVGAFLVFNMTFPLQSILSYITSSIQSRINLEVAITISIFLYYFLLSYLIIVELLLPLYHFTKLLEAISVWWEQVRDRYIRIVIGRIFWMPVSWISKRVLSVLRRSNIILKYVLVVPLCLAFIFDVFIGVIKISFFWIVVNIGAVVEFLMFLINGIVFLLSLFTRQSGARVLKTAFRLSAILSISFVVIAIRFSWYYTVDDTYLSITEFIASTILAPVFFEWIYSYDKRTGELKTE